MTEREFQALHQRMVTQFELADQACQYLERHCGVGVGDLALKVWRAIDKACAGLLRQGEPGFEAVEALKEEARRKACRALGAQVVLADGDFLAQKLFQTAKDALMAFAASLVEMRCAVEYSEDEVEAAFEAGEPSVQFEQMVDQPAMERVEL